MNSSSAQYEAAHFNYPLPTAAVHLTWWEPACSCSVAFPHHPTSHTHTYTHRVLGGGPGDGAACLRVGPAWLCLCCFRRCKAER